MESADDATGVQGNAGRVLMIVRTLAALVRSGDTPAYVNKKDSLR